LNLCREHLTENNDENKEEKTNEELEEKTKLEEIDEKSYAPSKVNASVEFSMIQWLNNSISGSKSFVASWSSIKLSPYCCTVTRSPL
jgi:hypothetical protein